MKVQKAMNEVQEVWSIQVRDRELLFTVYRVIGSKWVGVQLCGPFGNKEMQCFLKEVTLRLNKFGRELCLRCGLG